MQSAVSFGPGDYTPQYRKEYDTQGRVIKIVAGLFGLTLDDSISLLVRYNGPDVYLISEQNTVDTVLIASFNSTNQLTQIAVGNITNEDLLLKFEPLTEFAYAAGRLSVITRHVVPGFTLPLYTTYDQNGNIVRIYQQSDDANAGTFFTYDLSVKATAQYYSDQNGTDNLNNPVYIAECLGWLPDLEPVNKRVSFRQVFNDEDPTDNEPGYVFNHTDLTDHVYDSDGKLRSYKIADGAITYTNIWNCDVKKSPN